MTKKQTIELFAILVAIAQIVFLTLKIAGAASKKRRRSSEWSASPASQTPT